MPYTEPPTKGTGDPIGSAGWNTYIRDNIIYLKDQAATKHGAYARRSLSTVLTHNLFIAIEMNVEIEDTDTYHSNITNPSRFTIPSGLGGVYVCNAIFRWDTDAADAQATVGISKNGNHSLCRTNVYNAGGFTAGWVAWSGWLDDGEYVEFVVRQASGSNQTIDAVTSVSLNEPYSPSFSLYKV